MALNEQARRALEHARTDAIRRAGHEWGQVDYASKEMARAMRAYTEAMQEVRALTTTLGDLPETVPIPGTTLRRDAESPGCGTRRRREDTELGVQGR